MTWKKRIISIVLCLCALLCAASVRAEAADEHSHPICGASHKDVGDHTSAPCSNVTWQAWDGTDTIGNDFFKDSNTKYLYLSRDVEMSDKWTDTIVPEGKTLYLCLNGHSLTRKASGYTINVYGTLVLCDCDGSRQGKGVISHGKKDDGSLYGTEGIYVIDNAVFKMYGGKISGNNGGVIVSGGTFTMYGGEISHNTRTTSSAEGGGGVWVKDYKSWSSGQTTLGNFAMYGGTICNNEIQSSVFGGGGVGMDSDGSFYMENGTITGNKCNNSGGGLDIRCTTITIKGNSTISGNTCGGEGGGIFAISSGESSITNCTISGNNATGTNSKGGGLAFQNSTFTLEKCTIIDNKTTGKGGAICLMTDNAYVTLSSGLNFSGNQDNCPADKSGNLTTGTANDVFLHTGAYLRLASDFSKTSTAPIVVTTYFTPSDNSYQKIAVDNRTTPDPTDFKYGTDSNSAIGIIAKTNNGKVELLACKHSYSPQKDGTNHWQECSICKDKKDVTEHTYSNTWKKNSTQHWHECECGAKSGEADHAYSNEWKTGDGKHWHECECGQRSGEAEHSYSTAWDRDDTSHFHKCSVCDDKTDIAICVYTARVTSGHQKSAATCTAKAVYWKSCVCDRESTETFESGETNPNNHTGQLGNWQTNTDEHWKVYSCCQTKVQEGTHNWNEGAVTTPATCTAAGVKTYTCAVCSATKTETIDASGHTWGTDWVKDDSDKDHHWHECTKCHEKKDLTEHDWDEGTVTTPATCTTPGVKTFSCGTCSATKTETIGAKGHDFSVRQYGENDHWMKCSRCDATDTKEAHTGGEATCTQKAVCEKCGQKYGDLKAHDFANGPYQYDGEQHWYKCANCTATTESVAHTDFTAWKSDRSGHWHECSTCGYKTAVNAHTPDRDKATETTPQLCTECGYVIAPATHPVHTWVFVAETPATCNAAGEREHYKCTCGRTSFKNGDVYDINEDASVLTIAANHTGNIGEQWHSDSANHWQEYTCCHARANETAHSGGAATCTAQAVCQVCGKAYGPLAAHAWQPATCTTPKTCTACHVTDGAALGHDWGAWKVTTPATKDAPGVETRTCAHNSAHTETRSIPKLSTAVYTVSEDTKIAQIEAKVDGLDKILESNENKALVNDGKSVGVSLTVKNTASSGVSEKIKEKLAGSNLVGLRLELTVEKTVTANGVVEWKQTILDAGVLLKTTITLPAELQGKSGYVVYRLHDGNVHVLTETANENEEFISVSADKTQITICARLYSEYVIAYQTGGSSGGGYHPVNPTPVKATSANTGDAGVLLYGVTAALSLTGTAWLGAKSRKH